MENKFDCDLATLAEVAREALGWVEEVLHTKCAPQALLWARDNLKVLRDELDLRAERERGSDVVADGPLPEGWELSIEEETPW